MQPFIAVLHNKKDCGEQILKSNFRLYEKSVINLFVDILVRAGVCRPCVETELTATKKSATDGN